MMRQRANERRPSPEALFSMHALHRAWQQVRSAGDSPGIDRVTIKAFSRNLDEELNSLQREVLGGTYQPQPVKRIFIKKASGKQRPISLWTMRDRVAQRVIHDYLMLVTEPLFLDFSFGFRPGRAVADAVEDVNRARKAGLTWVLDADIADCFDSIPLDILIGQVQRIVPSSLAIQLIKAWLHTPVVHKPGEIAGLSQGGVISPLLANLYLHRFDEMILAALPLARMVRFADDFVILSRSEHEAAWSLEVARRSLANLKLALNMQKTRLVSFEQGFSFLGYGFLANSTRLVRAEKQEGERS